MRKLLAHALMERFKGRCWNCWEEGSHSATNCPIKEIAVCGKCKGGHHTNACEPVKEVNKRRTLGKKNKTHTIVKKSNKKKANVSTLSMDNERLQMCLANVLYETNYVMSEDDSEEEDNSINANVMRADDHSGTGNDSDGSDGWATESGTYYIGGDMNVRKNIHSHMVSIVADVDIHKEDEYTNREHII